MDRTFNLKPPHILDLHPIGKHFGAVKREPVERGAPGDVVEAEFWCAYPNNDYFTGRSFLEVVLLGQEGGGGDSGGGGGGEGSCN